MGHTESGESQGYPGQCYPGHLAKDTENALRSNSDTKTQSNQCYPGHLANDTENALRRNSDTKTQSQKHSILHFPFLPDLYTCGSCLSHFRGHLPPIGLESHNAKF